METVDQDLSHAHPMFIIDGATVPGALFSVGEAQDTPAQLLNTIVVEAYLLGATNIKVEADEKASGAHVWFGIDGVMLDYMQIPPHLREALLSHVKMMCGLNDARRRIAQISRIDFQQAGGEKIELRVVTLPDGSGGENLRLRLMRTPLALMA